MKAAHIHNRAGPDTTMDSPIHAVITAMVTV